MDNKASTVLTLTMTTMDIKYQLVPPSNHRGNNTERALQIFNKPFIEVLYSVDKYFHLQLRDILLQQVTIIINLITQSRTLTQISAYNHIFKQFDFKCTPLALSGKIVVMYNRPN